MTHIAKAIGYLGVAAASRITYVISAIWAVILHAIVS